MSFIYENTILTVYSNIPEANCYCSVYEGKRGMMVRRDKSLLDDCADVRHPDS